MRFSRILIFLAALVAAGSPSGAARAEESPPTYAIAMHGAPALAAGIRRTCPTPTPTRRRAGASTLAYLGAFDSLNPYNVKALSTAQGLVGNVYQSLMMRSADEPFTLYGLIARSIETDDARDRVAFHLDPAAHFSDGEKITAADVVFSFNLLKAKGPPLATRRLRPGQKSRDARRHDRDVSISPAPTIANCR